MSVVPRRFRGAAYWLRNRPPSQARDRDGPQQGRRAAGPWIRGPPASPVYYRAPMSTLLFSRLRKTYAATVAVDDVTFEVRPREVFGLLGPNGAGKTTLIRMLIDITAPASGDILLDGRPLGRADRDRIGYLPEERGLYRKEKVIDILAYFGMLKGLDRRTARARSLEWLEKIGMPEVANRRADSLSKGMQQKVQIAGSLLHDPYIVVMDEPFAGLDPLNTVLVKDLLRERRERGPPLLEKRIGSAPFGALRMPVEDIFVRTVRSRAAARAPPPPPVVAGAERRA